MCLLVFAFFAFVFFVCTYIYTCGILQAAPPHAPALQDGQVDDTIELLVSPALHCVYPLHCVSVNTIINRTWSYIGLLGAAIVIVRVLSFFNLLLMH